MQCYIRLVVGFMLAGFVAAAANDAEPQIQAVLELQVKAWNRGDIPDFVTTYAPDCIFVGKQIAHGRAQLLARYRKSYPTPEAMGHLAFHNLEIHELSADVAVVIGQWHIDRSATAGSGVGGLFSLVFQRRDGEWKITLDHTS